MGPKSARIYTERVNQIVLMPLEHPIILLKSNKFNMDAVSVKKSIVLDRHLLSNGCVVLATMLKQLLPFSEICEQNIGLENISRPKKLTFHTKLQFIGIFLNVYPPVWTSNFVFQRFEMISAKSTTHRKYILLMQQTCHMLGITNALILFIEKANSQQGNKNTLTLIWNTELFHAWIKTYQQMRIFFFWICCLINE